METETNLFDKLDAISSKEDEISKAIGVVQQDVLISKERIGQLEKTVQSLQSKPVSKPTSQNQNSLKIFARRARKSWRWFGNIQEFKKSKLLALLFVCLNIVFGIVAVIVTTISCNLFTTFTAFEIVNWVVAIYASIMLLKSPIKYEVRSFASGSPFSCKFDDTGMAFPGKEKVYIKVVRWIGVIAAIANIAYIWISKSNLSVLATIIEALFIVSIILNWFFSISFYAQYTICWLEGRNLNTNEPVTIVRDNISGFMLEKEFRDRFPSLLG